MELSDRAKSIPPSITLAIGAKVKELKAAGYKVIAFGAGEPDFATPDKICDAAIQALKSGVTHYMPSAGTPDANAGQVQSVRANDDASSAAVKLCS